MKVPRSSSCTAFVKTMAMLGMQRAPRSADEPQRGATFVVIAVSDDDADLAHNLGEGNEAAVATVLELFARTLREGKAKPRAGLALVPKDDAGDAGEAAG